MLTLALFLSLFTSFLAGCSSAGVTGTFYLFFLGKEGVQRFGGDLSVVSFLLLFLASCACSSD